MSCSRLENHQHCLMMDDQARRRMLTFAFDITATLIPVKPDIYTLFSPWQLTWKQSMMYILGTIMSLL